MSGEASSPRGGQLGPEASLVAAFAAAIRAAIGRLPDDVRAHTTVLMTAHSLPRSVIDAGDPYEREVRASAQAIAAALGPDAPPYDVAFQSQGFGGGVWLGPDVPDALSRAAAAGRTHVLFAPIGFLADHVEILYDIDVEAAAWARERGMTSSRSASLNASPELVGAVAELVDETLPEAWRRA